MNEAAEYILPYRWQIIAAICWSCSVISLLIMGRLQREIDRLRGKQPKAERDQGAEVWRGKTQPWPVAEAKDVFVHSFMMLTNTPRSVALRYWREDLPRTSDVALADSVLACVRSYENDRIEVQGLS